MIGFGSIIFICRFTSSRRFFKQRLNPVMRLFMLWEGKHWRCSLRTFALIVSAHPYCARNSLRDVMPRHALSGRVVEEMWRSIALVGTLISMHGFNSLKCSVTSYFLLIDHFLCGLSKLCEKLKSMCCGSLFFFQLFCPGIIEFCYYCSCTVLAKVYLYLTDPLK